MSRPPSEDRSEGDLNLGAPRERWVREQLDDETRALLADDEQYYLRQALSTPCLDVLTGAAGARLTTHSGRELLDFHGNSVHQVGYGHPRVVEAIKRQLDTLPFCPRRYTNEPAIELAQKLAELAPADLDKVLLAPGGTSAIGIALKLARVATGRFKTISMWDSFHGASLDAISIGGEAMFRRGIGPLLPGAEHVPPPEPAGCPWRCGAACSLECADYIEYVLEKEGDVAAVVAETIRSTPSVPPADYWKRIRAACDRHGALLILDEIPHALGRTGKMFTCEHFGIAPDMLVVGKGLGGGVFPLAALIARRSLDLAPAAALGHYTHEKNPVACAAALATIACIEEEGLLERSRALGAKALERLRAMQKRHPLIGEVRGLGLFLGVVLVRDGDPKKPAIDEAEAVLYHALTRGLSFKVTMGNVLALSPPLTISEDELTRAFDILERSIELANEPER